MSAPRLSLLLATVLSGLSAGFFFAYEASMTLGLAAVSDLAYVETFQAINETVRNPAFGIVFFGSIPAIGLALAANWKTAEQLSRVLMALALTLYLAGLIMTGARNVPLNNDLADYGSLTADIAARARADFENDWNQLNLIRALLIGTSFTTLVVAGGLKSPNGHDGGQSASPSQTE